MLRQVVRLIPIVLPASLLGGCLSASDGAALTGGLITGTVQTIISQQAARQSVGAGRPVAMQSLSSGDLKLPDTTACRRYLALTKSSVSLHRSPRQTLIMIHQHYHDCLNSAPHHPTSRRLRCGPGKYVSHALVWPGTMKPICGMDEVRAYARQNYNDIPLGLQLR